MQCTLDLFQYCYRALLLTVVAQSIQWRRQLCIPLHVWNNSLHSNEYGGIQIQELCVYDGARMVYFQRKFPKADIAFKHFKYIFVFMKVSFAKTKISKICAMIFFCYLVFVKVARPLNTWREHLNVYSRYSGQLCYFKNIFRYL